MAFEKEWGMQKGIQPVQYINPNSELTKDFAEAFTVAMKLEEQNENAPQTKMQNFLLHELMYYKPYDGLIKNRNTNKKKRKCFADECEWRFIPNVSGVGFHQVLRDEQIINVDSFEILNNGLEKVVNVALSFNYEDLKYIIIEKKEDFYVLLDTIKNINISDDEKYLLTSKIIIWESSKGDF